MAKMYGDFQAMKFKNLLAEKPTILDTYTYDGQTIVLCEHPIYGDEFPIIAYCKKHKVAWNTCFYDCDELTESGGDYQQRYYPETDTVMSRFEAE